MDDVALVRWKCEYHAEDGRELGPVVMWDTEGNRRKLDGWHPRTKAESLAREHDAKLETS